MLELSLHLPIGLVLNLRVLLHVRGCTTNGSHTSYLEQQHKTGTEKVYLTTVRGQAFTFRNSVYTKRKSQTHTQETKGNLLNCHALVASFQNSTKQ